MILSFTQLHKTHYCLPHYLSTTSSSILLVLLVFLEAVTRASIAVAIAMLAGSVRLLWRGMGAPLLLGVLLAGFWGVARRALGQAPGPGTPLAFGAALVLGVVVVIIVIILVLLVVPHRGVWPLFLLRWRAGAARLGAGTRRSGPARASFFFIFNLLKIFFFFTQSRIHQPTKSTKTHNHWQRYVLNI